MTKVEKRNLWVFIILATLLMTESLVSAQVELPAPYASKRNPIPAMDSITAGKKIYTEQCEPCHGEQGDGKGPVGATLKPRPADFTDAKRMEQLSDAYLFWRISEGGGFEPFNSAMPAKKGVLSENDIWNVINYVRTFSFEKPKAPSVQPQKEDVSKLGVNLRAYTIGSIGILATIVLMIFAYILVRKEGY